MKFIKKFDHYITAVFVITIIVIVATSFFTFKEIFSRSTQKQQEAIMPLFSLITSEIIRPITVSQYMASDPFLLNYIQQDEIDNSVVFNYITSVSNKFNTLSFIAMEKHQRLIDSAKKVTNLDGKDAEWYHRLKAIDKTEFTDFGDAENPHLFFDVKMFNKQQEFIGFVGLAVDLDHFSKKFKGHGWVGIRFQLDPLEGYNEIILHIRFKENIARQQQETLGILGTNLIYSAFYKYHTPKKIIKYLYDNLEKDQLEIDTINFSGPIFKNVDNRLMSLELVKNGLTEAVMFGSDGNNLLPAAILYKKNILALRGRFRPVTKVNEDMYLQSLKLFEKENKVEKDNTIVIFEITLADLENKGEIDEKDFMDRAKLLGSLGETVLISNYKEYYRLVEYFSMYTNKKIGLCMGVNNLIQVFDPKYYIKLGGGILEAFGKLFFKKLKVYLYPVISEDGEIITSENLKVHPRIKELYKFFKFNGRIEDVKDYNVDSLKIHSNEVLEDLQNNNTGWEKMLPKSVASKIKKQKLFGYKGN